MNLLASPARKLCLSLSTALVLLSFGCGKNAAPPALSLEEAPAQIENVFQEAATEVKQMANQAASALQDKNQGKALAELQALCASPDLTAEQRDVATRSVLAVTEELRAAAARGDQRAAEILQVHQNRKLGAAALLSSRAPHLHTIQTINSVMKITSINRFVASLWVRDWKVTIFD